MPISGANFAKRNILVYIQFFLTNTSCCMFTFGFPITQNTEMDSNVLLGYRRGSKVPVIISFLCYVHIRFCDYNLEFIANSTSSNNMYTYIHTSTQHVCASVWEVGNLAKQRDYYV